MKKISTFFAHAKEELYKVIFPTKVQVRQAFFAVMLVVVAVALFLALVDFIMSLIVSSVI
ncbi:MAG: preprotein translocase subunit SecE [Sulfurovaceae bacterium]|jgi:preprotein translocase subunit SecE|nr:preprotein translocase subunit SecE [Sulfurovaceae bacterium]